MAEVARKPRAKKNHALDSNGFYVAADGAVRANKYTCDSCAQGLVLVHRRRVASRSAVSPDEVQLFFRHFPDEALACVDGYTPNGQPVDYYGAAVRAAQRDRRQLVLGCSECDQDLPFPYVITDRNLNGFNQKYGEDLLKLALDRDGTYRMKVGVRCPWIETPRCPSCGARHAAEQVAAAEAAEKERADEAAQHSRDAQERVENQLRDAQEREAAQQRYAEAATQREAAREAARQRHAEAEAERNAERERCAVDAEARRQSDAQELARARGREWCSALKTPQLNTRAPVAHLAREDSFRNRSIDIELATLTPVLAHARRLRLSGFTGLALTPGVPEIDPPDHTCTAASLCERRSVRRYQFKDATPRRCIGCGAREATSGSDTLTWPWSADAPWWWCAQCRSLHLTLVPPK